MSDSARSTVSTTAWAISSAVARDGGHEEHDAGGDVRVGEDVRDRGRVRRGGRAAQHVDGIRDARLGREHRAQTGDGVLAQRGQLEAGGLARVGAEDPEAARIRHDPDRAALEPPARREQRGDVDELLQRLGANHAGLPEERVRGGVGARERGRVRARGALAALGATALEREDRLAARDPAGDAREPPRVPERLDVEQDRLGRRVVLPPLEQVVRRDVRLVADRDERRQAEAARDRRLEEREAERAALRREADVAGRRRA